MGRERTRDSQTERGIEKREGYNERDIERIRERGRKNEKKRGMD